jgi:hypothetical protein
MAKGKTDMINVMVDLETWGTRLGDDCRSIGACVFDPITGKTCTRLKGHRGITGEGTFYVATDNPVIYGQPGNYDGVGAYRKYRLSREPSTVKWWLEQGEEAKAAFADPVELRDALACFGVWLSHLPGEREDLRIWAHGPTFDLSMLATYYAAVGLPVPWHYRAPRDTRTLFDAAGIDDHSAFMAQTNYGVPHHALDDAIAQAMSVCAAWAIIRGRDSAMVAGTMFEGADPATTPGTPAGAPQA